jgi:exopolyphosphatase/guanosine-5'-triphosphate,3'-diphosphate pyrophosphatase
MEKVGQVRGVDSTTAAIATIDVGTNTTLLLVARPGATPGAEPEVLENAAEITRLGRGIGGDGRLGAPGIAATLDALGRYAGVIARHRAQVFAVGTEALRRAPNAAEFLVPAEALLGRPIEVIDGTREADLTFRAVVQSFPKELRNGRAAIVDIGGGSTELVVVEDGAAVARTSLPLGSVRLTERHVRHDPPTAEETAAIRGEIRERLASAHVLDGLRDGAAGGAESAQTVGLFGVAGTVTSLCAMALGLATYDPARVHGSWLSREALDAQIARLAAADQMAREKMVGLDPKRADVIYAGALLLDEIARACGVATVRVSDRGIRWGLFFEHASRP